MYHHALIYTEKRSGQNLRAIYILEQMGNVDFFKLI